MEYVETIYDITTGKTTTREYTDEEIATVKAAELEAKAKAKEAEIKEAARLAVLEKLGLTADEAAALLG